MEEVKNRKCNTDASFLLHSVTFTHSCMLDTLMHGKKSNLLPPGEIITFPTLPTKLFTPGILMSYENQLDLPDCHRAQVVLYVQGFFQLY